MYDWGRGGKSTEFQGEKWKLKLKMVRSSQTRKKLRCHINMFE
jgi:hypothetical protein